MKTCLKLVLSFALVFCAFFVLCVSSSAYSVGDHIQFGTYPQSRVMDSVTLSKLNATNTSWHYYDYYISSTQTDFMQYRDAVVGETKYRAVKFSKYRPRRTDLTSTEGDSDQDNNGYDINTTYWFKYEPISWRVLDPSTGFIMAEVLLDSQPYNNYVKYVSSGGSLGSGLYGDSSCTYWASNYAKSSIRKWLNEDFYNTAFTSSQKNNIKTTHLENKSKYSSSYDAPDTDDKIFLLSYWDTVNTSYGFDAALNYDAARSAQGSEYAKVQGLCVYRSSESSYDGNSYWRLRSPNSSYGTIYVYYDGYVNDYYSVNDTYSGIRPACKLSHLKSDISTSWNCSISGHRWSSGTVTKKATCTKTGVRTYTCSRCGKTYDEEIPALGHNYKDVLTKATLKKNGKIESKCSRCGNVSSTKTILYPCSVFLAENIYEYNGKVRTPKVYVFNKKDKLISSKYYTVSYSKGRKELGTYSVTVTFKGNYSGSKVLKFKILPKSVNSDKLKAKPYDENRIKASWANVGNVDGYKVYRYDNKEKKYKLYKKTTKTSLLIERDSKKTDSVNFVVKTYRKYDNKTYTSLSQNGFGYCKLAAPKITIEKDDFGSFIVHFPYYEQYNVQISNNKEFSNSDTDTSKKLFINAYKEDDTGKTYGKSWKFSELKSNYTYYVRVRRYYYDYSSGSKKLVVGPWSEVKKVIPY